MAFDFPDTTNQPTDGTFTHTENTSHGQLTYAWNGTYWIAIAGSDLGDLDDVTITDAAAQDVLVYNGSVWQNESDLNGGSF